MSTQVRVMLLTKSDSDDPRRDRAVEYCQRCFPGLQVERGTWGDPLPQSVRDFDGDFLLSYMSRWIIPVSVLSRVKVASINFHPAPPEYPGVGCTNFALYDDVKEYGVTCHHMESVVDTGNIVDVRRFAVYPSDDVASLLARTYDQLLVLFYDIVERIQRRQLLPKTGDQWARLPFRRDELNALCRVDSTMPVEEIRRRVRATTFNKWRPTVEIGGYTFGLLENQTTSTASVAVPPISTKPDAERQNRYSAGSQPDSDDFNIMLSAAGRRVALLRILRESLLHLDLRGRFIATDVTPLSAAFQVADKGVIVHRYSDERCLSQLLNLCTKNRIRLIIPTIDPDLQFYAQHRQKFRAVGTEIMLSSLETVNICADKKETHHWLQSNGFSTMRQIDADLLLGEGHGWNFPVFVKPRRGSSSVGARIVEDAQELKAVIRSGGYIAQDVAAGQEYTVDVFIDRAGHCRCIVPRMRIETRGGEVVKGATVRCPAIEKVARRIAETLPGAAGIINVQVFYNGEGSEVIVSEINPRLGGGYPLAHQAGARMTDWFIQEMLGKPIPDSFTAWTDGLVMLRYDEGLFVRGGAEQALSGRPGGEVGVGAVVVG